VTFFPISTWRSRYLFRQPPYPGQMVAIIGEAGSHSVLSKRQGAHCSF
jgi:hypothetical protein